MTYRLEHSINPSHGGIKAPLPEGIWDVWNYVYTFNAREIFLAQRWNATERNCGAVSSRIGLLLKSIEDVKPLTPECRSKN